MAAQQVQDYLERHRIGALFEVSEFVIGDLENIPFLFLKLGLIIIIINENTTNCLSIDKADRAERHNLKHCRLIMHRSKKHNIDRN